MIYNSYLPVIPRISSFAYIFNITAQEESTMTQTYSSNGTYYRIRYNKDGTVKHEALYQDMTNLRGKWMSVTKYNEIKKQLSGE